MKTYLNSHTIVNKFFYDSVGAIYNSIKAHTPIDTGRARSSWSVNKNNDFNYSIKNSVPYIKRLDNGWSQQKPLGILYPMYQEIPSKLKSIFYQTFK